LMARRGRTLPRRVCGRMGWLDLMSGFLLGSRIMIVLSRWKHASNNGRCVIRTYMFSIHVWDNFLGRFLF
jgi:hypothetical protein